MKRWIFLFLFLMSQNLLATHIEIEGVFPYETLRTAILKCGWEHIVAPLWKQSIKTEPIASQAKLMAETRLPIAENGLENFFFSGEISQEDTSLKVYHEQGSGRELIELKDRFGSHGLEPYSHHHGSYGYFPYFEFVKKITKLKTTESGEIVEFEASASRVWLILPEYHGERVGIRNRKTGAMAAYELNTVADANCLKDALK